MPSKGSTEVDAYAFIKSELRVLGWDVRNPSTHPQGQVYTQNQCLSNPEIKRWLDKKRPEYIVKVNETILWIIEAKSERNKIGQALDEAENYYAKHLNNSTSLKAVFISGVAGNDSDGYNVESKFLEGNTFKSIELNGKKATGLLYPEIISKMLRENSASLADIPIDQAFFMKKAEQINEILHVGAVNINDRAKVMAALLLTTLDESSIDLNAEPTVLIDDINTRAKNGLAKEGKEEFYEYVKLSPPTARDNHAKYKKALVDTLKELYSLNIRSAMNSGTDILGQFYEVFLKYGNWAQKMGIVLTPRHITRFAVKVLDISLHDIVFDPTCGTGGFLVAAFDHIKSMSNKSQIETFKNTKIFGIDQQPQLVSLAIVNMIFRGDGKTNIIEGNCFAKWLKGTTKNGTPTAEYVKAEPKEEEKVVTRVLMNPSFAIKPSDEKEYKFVQHALNQMAYGQLLFCVLPTSVMFQQGEPKNWREERLLQENTLLSVITFPIDLFYPIGVHTLGIIVKKGVPHPAKQNVLWIRAFHDGHIKVKGKRLPSKDEPDDLTTSIPLISAFVRNPSFPIEPKPEFCKSCPIDFTDTLLELIPEAYLDSKPITSNEIEEGMERLVRENAAFLIKNFKENEANEHD